MGPAASLHGPLCWAIGSLMTLALFIGAAAPKHRCTLKSPSHERFRKFRGQSNGSICYSMFLPPPSSFIKSGPHVCDFCLSWCKSAFRRLRSFVLRWCGECCKRTSIFLPPCWRGGGDGRGPTGRAPRRVPTAPRPRRVPRTARGTGPLHHAGGDNPAKRMRRSCIVCRSPRSTKHTGIHGSAVF